jgi:hypothetical protein
MSKAIEGAALLAGAVIITAATGGFGAIALVGVSAAFAGAGGLGAGIIALGAAGIAMEAGAIASALTSNRGMDITTRQAASPRQIIYGMQRVGGEMVYQSTTGSKLDQYNMVIVVAGHPVWGFEELYLDGRKVFWQGSGTGYLPSPGGVYFGGVADGNNHEGPDGQQYNFGGTGHSGIYAEASYGTQTAANLITGLTANDPAWNTTASGTPYLGGCSYFYFKCEYNASLFPQRPEIRVTVMGKPVFDPRTGVTAYSANSALICADWITNAEYGPGMQVNQAQLIAAANICDEQVPLANQPSQPDGITSGLTEARYQCHFHFDTETSPTDALNTMLKSMGGRVSLIGGEIYLFPAVWVGSSAEFDESVLTAPVTWDPTAAYKSALNQVRGTYTAPNYPYNIAGNLYDKNGFAPDGTLLNTWQFGFTPTSFPPYAQDPLHGYAANQWLNQDSGVTAAWASGTTFALGQIVSYITTVVVAGVSLNYAQVYKSLVASNHGNTPSPTSTKWQLAAVNLNGNASYNMVLSIGQAQRLAKIDLMRGRFWGRGKLEMGLSAYTLQECDVMSFSFPPHTWVGKTLEILGSTLSVKSQEGSVGAPGQAPEIRVTWNVGETDPSIYTWAATEELSVYDVPLTQMGMASAVAPPTAMGLLSGPATAAVSADGIVTARIEVTWDTPQDPFATSIKVQYQLAGAATWIDAGSASVELNQFFIGPIVAGSTYNVQIAAVRPNGGISVWVEEVITASLVSNLLGSLLTAGLSSALNLQAGLTGFGNLQFTYAGTTTTITVSWVEFDLYRSDGSTTVVAAGSFTFTGLTPSTTYDIGCSLNVATLTIVNWMTSVNTLGAATTFSNATLTTVLGLDGNVALLTGGPGMQGSTGATGGGGGGVSGGGGGVPRCPAVEMFVAEARQVGDLLPGDILDCTDGKHAVERVEISHQPCTRIWTDVGHELITSDSTPFHLPSGRQILASGMDGLLVLTDTGDGSAKVWMPCHAESVSARAVNQIYAGDRIFAAGTSANARIYSHNQKPVQYL